MKRVPPHSIESEEAILGTMLLTPTCVCQIVSELHHSDFYVQKHAIIFRAMGTIYKESGNLDVLLLSEELKRNDQIEKIGGFITLATLTDIVSHSATVGSHCKVVKDKSKARDIIAAASLAVDSCYSGHEVDGALSELGSALTKASREDVSNTATSHEIVETVLANIKGRHDGSISNHGIPSGFSGIDSLLGGLQKQELIILAARPSMGKTTLAMNMVTSAANVGKKTLVFSLEMPKEKLAEKQISEISKVSIKAIQRNLLNDQTWPRVKQAAQVVSNLSVTIDDSSALDITQIHARAKNLAMREGVDLIVIDYLQLAKAKALNREREVSEISAGLKALAKDLNVPVIALSQLNRSLENRTDRRPVMSDLRDSGSIEQDADVIAFIYRDEVYNPASGNPARGTAEILIRKNRCGETGTVKLGFDGATCRFSDLSTPAEYV